MLISSTDPAREYKASLFKAIEAAKKLPSERQNDVAYVNTLRSLIKRYTMIDIYDARKFVYAGRTVKPSVPRLVFSVGSIGNNNNYLFNSGEYYWDDFYNAVKRARLKGSREENLHGLHPKGYWIRNKDGKFLDASKYFIYEGEAYEKASNCVIDNVLYKNRVAIDVPMLPNNTSSFRNFKMMLDEGDKYTDNNYFKGCNRFVKFALSFIRDEQGVMQKRYFSWVFINSLFKYKGLRQAHDNYFCVDAKELDKLEFSISQAHKDFISRLDKELSTRNVDWAKRFAESLSHLRISLAFDGGFLDDVEKVDNPLLSETLQSISGRYLVLEDLPKVLELLKSLVKEVYKDGK